MQANKKEEDDLVIYNYPVAFTGKVSSHCCWHLHIANFMAQRCCSHAFTEHDIRAHAMHLRSCQSSAV